MTTRALLEHAGTEQVPAASFGVAGAPGTRLLAGPPAISGAEALGAHVERLGAPAKRGGELLDAVEAGGLAGRGGAGFSTAEKMRRVAAGPGPHLVVVNASESEPASRKDRVLVELRPHLVLDGAVLAAEAVRAAEVVVQLHRNDPGGIAALRRALEERARQGIDRIPVRLSAGPDRYVAGESSAVVAFLEGAAARPRPSLRAAVCGAHGRPTLVSNAETLAHVALIARFGPTWFRSAGSPSSPGSLLVTMAGDVDVSGTVLEVWGPVPVGSVVASVTASLAEHPPAALLTGGYGGSWIAAGRAWPIPLWRDELATAGAALGCGLIGVLSSDACGLAETANLLDYLAAQSAGQCGPCAFGLPDLAAQVHALATRRVGRGALRRIYQRAASVVGRGGCAHPDGAVGLLESALETFADDVRYHLRHGPCPGVGRQPTFPTPRPRGGWR